MNRLLIASLAGMASLSVGCLNNGAIDGEMVMKCYYDQTVVETLEDDTEVTYIERTIYNQFAYDLSEANPDATIIGRINNDNEFQLTAIIECDTECRKVCGAPPFTDDEGNAVEDPGAIDVERLTVHVVAGREELSGVDEADWPLYSPAYYNARGDSVDASGACLTGDELAANFDVEQEPYDDPMGFALAQLNTDISANIASSGDYRNAEDGCTHNPWAEMSLDDSTLVVKRGDVTGSVQVSNLEIVNNLRANVLIDVHATSDPSSPATFSIEGLIENGLTIETVVTNNNEPYDLGL